MLDVTMRRFTSKDACRVFSTQSTAYTCVCLRTPWDRGFEQAEKLRIGLPTCAYQVGDWRCCVAANPLGIYFRYDMSSHRECIHRNRYENST